MFNTFCHLDAQQLVQEQKSPSEEAAEDYVKSNHSSEMNSACLLLQHLKMQCF